MGVLSAHAARVLGGLLYAEGRAEQGPARRQEGRPRRAGSTWCLPACVHPSVRSSSTDSAGYMLHQGVQACAACTLLGLQAWVAAQPAPVRTPVWRKHAAENALKQVRVLWLRRRCYAWLAAVACCAYEQLAALCWRAAAAAAATASAWRRTRLRCRQPLATKTRSQGAASSRRALQNGKPGQQPRQRHCIPFASRKQGWDCCVAIKVSEAMGSRRDARPAGVSA